MLFRWGARDNWCRAGCFRGSGLSSAARRIRAERGGVVGRVARACGGCLRAHRKRPGVDRVLPGVAVLSGVRVAGSGRSVGGAGRRPRTRCVVCRSGRRVCAVGGDTVWFCAGAGSAARVGGGSGRAGRSTDRAGDNYADARSGRVGSGRQCCDQRGVRRLHHGRSDPRRIGRCERRSFGGVAAGLGDVCLCRADVRGGWRLAGWRCRASHRARSSALGDRGRPPGCGDSQAAVFSGRGACVLLRVGSGRGRTRSAFAQSGRGRVWGAAVRLGVGRHRGERVVRAVARTAGLGADRDAARWRSASGSW